MAESAAFRLTLEAPASISTYDGREVTFHLMNTVGGLDEGIFGVLGEVRRFMQECVGVRPRAERHRSQARCELLSLPHGRVGQVFTTRHGTPIEPRNFSRSFDRCIVKAAVPRITVHGTRKPAAHCSPPWTYTRV